MVATSRNASISSFLPSRLPTLLWCFPGSFLNPKLRQPLNIPKLQHFHNELILQLVQLGARPPLYTNLDSHPFWFTLSSVWWQSLPRAKETFWVYIHLASKPVYFISPVLAATHQQETIFHPDQALHTNLKKIVSFCCASDQLERSVSFP